MSERMQLAGLASGFDWKSVVDQLINLERAPQRRMRTQQATHTAQIDALGKISGNLESLRTASTALLNNSLFNARKVGFSQSGLGWSATAGADSLPGSLTLNVTQLATASSRTSQSSVSGTAGTAATLIADLRLAQPISDGSFTVNGQAIEVDGSQTLGEVLDAISTATGGVVTGSYDPVADRVTLASSNGQLELGQAGDTTNFLSALRLQQSAVQPDGGGGLTVTSGNTLGRIDLSAPIESSGLAGGLSGAGHFLVNGVRIDFDASTDSLRAVMDRVNASNAGARLSYDSAGDRFILSNTQTGEFALPVSDGEGTFIAALGLGGGAALTSGQNARLSVNGGIEQEHSSNTFDASLLGAPGLSVTATSVGQQEISVSNDTAGLKKAVENFVEKYNAAQSHIESQIRIDISNSDNVTSGTLARNGEITSLNRNLRAAVFQAVPDADEAFRRLESLGIDFVSGSSRLEIKDPARLDQALAENPESVRQLFQAPQTGLLARITSLVNNSVGPGKSLNAQQDRLNARNREIDQQIDNMERRLTRQRQAMEAAFIQMEIAQSNIQRQLQALQSNLQMPTT
ncbi:MAG: hypothetical protein EA425_11985 [Puniceicoccaceae bacterium]|nr:MAG: hypothetical protein EA425_11985 [Puniceicoccaceae bacterium]